MQIFLQEYLFFVVAAFAILVSVASASLFLLTYKYEQQLRTVWRAVGFLELALAFFLLVLERKFPVFELPALGVLLIGFYSIYKGVLAEPVLSHLQKLTSKKNLWPKS